MTFDSEDDVKAVLDEGYLFELVHQEDDSERRNLVRHVEPHRPSMTPLRGPPTFWWGRLGDDEKFSVRLPDVVDLEPVSYDQVPDPMLGDTLRTLTAIVGDDPERVPSSVLEQVLTDARERPAESLTEAALELALAVVESDADAFEAIAEPTFGLLEETATDDGNAVLGALVDRAQDEPGAVEQYVTDLVRLLSAESPYRRRATQCLMEVAEANPTATVDAVPALSTVAAEAEGTTRSYAIYALSQVAREFPDHVYPALDALVDAVDSEDATMQTNATTALGRIAGEYPDAAASIVDEIAVLLEADAKKVRNNAAGLLGDIATEHPGAVIEHAEALVARLDDVNVQARINATHALNRAGEADPEAVRRHDAELEAALDDASPDVRANVCTLVGNARVSVPIDRLRDLRDGDPNETVREQAAWAVERLS